MFEVITTNQAPQAVGPFSQGIKINGLLFISGQLSIDPATGQFKDGAVAEQTEQVLKNLVAVLEAAGSSLEKVVKTTVFLKDLNDFAAMNEVYARFFPQHPPARSTVEVARLYRDMKVEIDAIALV
jgi:2-iminobutanoate/2-iminopropanoate deaminase